MNAGDSVPAAADGDSHHALLRESVRQVSVGAKGHFAHPTAARRRPVHSFRHATHSPRFDTHWQCGGDASYQSSESDRSAARPSTDRPRWSETRARSNSGSSHWGERWYQPRHQGDLLPQESTSPPSGGTGPPHRPSSTRCDPSPTSILRPCSVGSLTDTGARPELPRSHRSEGIGGSCASAPCSDGRSAGTRASRDRFLGRNYRGIRDERR
jgi:hypothetical protein